MTEAERLELMLEYVAGTLDADAAERVRTALAAGDPAWAGARAEAEATLAAYAGAIAPVAPRHDLKSQLMTRVAREQDAVLRHRPIPDPHDPYRGLQRFAKGFAAVAALIFIAVVLNVWVNRRIQLAVDQVRKDQAAQLLEAKAQVMMLQSMIERDNDIRQVIENARFKVVNLDSDDKKASGRILIDEDHRTWYVYTSGLAQLPAEKVYELWYITPDGKKIPADAFKLTSDGNGWLKVRLPASVGAISVAAITDEQGMVQQPAGSVQLKGALPPSP